MTDDELQAIRCAQRRAFHVEETAKHFMMTGELNPGASRVVRAMQSHISDDDAIRASRILHQLREKQKEHDVIDKAEDAESDKPSDVGSENYNRVMAGLEEIAEWPKPTLREKVLYDMIQLLEDGFSAEVVLANIAIHLEDTGSPAHMRVAAELRGLDDA